MWTECSYEFDKNLQRKIIQNERKYPREYRFNDYYILVLERRNNPKSYTRQIKMVSISV